MSPAMLMLQRGLIHAVKHALSAWEKFLSQAEGAQSTTTVKGSARHAEPEHTSRT